MSYIKLSFTTYPEEAEALSDSLMALDALSISFQDAKDEPIFQIKLGETPLWQNTKVDALFEASTNIEPIIKTLNTLHKDIEFQVEKIEDQDWVRLTQQRFQPKQYGKQLWIYPAWHKVENTSDTIVKIDPGLAFGTGTHPTTDLCLTWLSENPPHNKTVIDYGCGSGILSLAALALGAKKVSAVDHDPQAIIATENNARLNDFYNANQLITSLPENLEATKADLILANILANPLIELAPQLINMLNPGGQLVLSGILEKEIECVVAAYRPQLNLHDTALQEEWVRLVFNL